MSLGVFEVLGGPWGSWVSLGVFWRSLGVFEGLWGSLGVLESLEAYGGFVGCLGSLRVFGDLLKLDL